MAGGLGAGRLTHAVVAVTPVARGAALAAVGADRVEAVGEGGGSAVASLLCTLVHVCGTEHSSGEG